MLDKSEHKPFYASGLHFSCTRCSACCRYEEGYVFLSEKDAFLLGTALKMDYDQFVETYCRWIPSSNGNYQLSLNEKANNDCIFWTTLPKEGCSVYDNRPLQCRSYPFWASIVRSRKSWEETAHNCPGVNHGALHSGDAITNWLDMRRSEPIITRTEVNRREN